MKKQQLLLAALIFGTSAWANASVPIVEPVEVQKIEANFNSVLALNNYFFGIKNNSRTDGAGVGDGVYDLQSAPVSHTAAGAFSGDLKQEGNTSGLTNHKVSVGSFSSYIEQASDVGALGAERRTGWVASTSAPKSWAVLLLALGCVIYQGRRRQRRFGLRKLV